MRSPGMWGGVGVVISRAFLDQVIGVGIEPVWEPDLIPGRLARMSLRGPQGQLDLYVVYVQAGDGPQEK